MEERPRSLVRTADGAFDDVVGSETRFGDRVPVMERMHDEVIGTPYVVFSSVRALPNPTGAQKWWV